MRLEQNENDFRTYSSEMEIEDIDVDSPSFTPHSLLGIYSYDSDSEVEKDGTNLVERMENRRQKQREKIHHPMSSPVRKSRHQAHFPTRGCKYTLRSAGYIPFRKRLDEKRAFKQLEQRGGIDEMEKFVYLRQEKQLKEKLRIESQMNSVSMNEPSIYEDIEEASEKQREIEKMIADQEDDELDALIANLDLNKKI